MPTRDDIYAAIRNADAAGDAESVRKLAGYLDSIKDGPASPQVAPLTRIEKIGQGIVDPIEGGAQLLTKALPAGVVEAGNKFNNWLADKTGLVARLPEGGVDQQVRENESTYQARRAAGGESGIDAYRLVGNVVSPANLGIARAAPVLSGLGGRVLTGAAVGAASGALAPVGEGDFAAEKTKQMGLGALGGGIIPAAAGGVARLISPLASTNADVSLLRDANVRTTIGQTLGGVANTLEQKLTSVPLLGGAIQKARGRAAEDLNTAAFNRALKPIGEALPADLKGRDAVEYTGALLGKKYDALLPKLTTQADAPLIEEIQSLRGMMTNGSIDPSKAAQFESLLQNQVLSKFQPGVDGAPTLTGQTMKQIESDLGQLVNKFHRSLDPDQILVGDALQEVQASLRKAVMRSNPSEAPQLQKINEGWANFKRPQRAAAALGADEGVFTPAQLQSAVKALDRSKDKAAFARGDALMQDLSEAGKKVLGNSVPDSGTAGRLMTAGAAGTLPALAITAASNPFAAGAALASPLAYSSVAQNALRALVASRPEFAQPVANRLRQIAPSFVPIGAQLGIEPLK